MSATIIIPVRDGAAMLAACLDTIVPQANALDAEVIVVDDASCDNSASIAERRGAIVLRQELPSGPYTARNAAWRRARHDRVVFTDVRCRAADGWLRGVLAELDQPGTAIAGCDVVVVDRGPLAARVAARAQPMMASRGSERAFLPFAPTCCLATTQAVLQTLGGFAEVRGGADVDLCWRAQLQGLGELRFASSALMTWEPRDKVRDLLEQYRRYGSNTRWLQERHAPAGCPVDPVAARWRVWGRAGLRLVHSLRGEPVRNWPVISVEAACRVAAIEGHRQAARRAT